MVEKRKLKRRHLIYYLRVYEDKSKTPLGYMADIHSQGIMLISDNPIKTNKLFKLRMELPQQIGTKAQIEFTARSLWGKKGINDNEQSLRNIRKLAWAIRPDLIDLAVPLRPPAEPWALGCTFSPLASRPMASLEPLRIPRFRT